MANLPFVILRYEPDKETESEWEVRKRARLLAHKLEARGFRVHMISMANFLWQAIDNTEGIEAIIRLEKERGFETAQRQINLLLSDPDFAPLPKMLSERLSGLDFVSGILFSLCVRLHLPLQSTMHPNYWRK